jgi:outer membrane immunogenic protein
MRRFQCVSLAAAAAAVGFASVASAADMPTKAPVYKAALVAHDNWTGCYVGGNLGVAWSNQNQNRIDEIGVGPAPADYGSDTDSGFAGGGQIGCDYQFASSWVVGVRGQFDWGSLSGSHAVAAFPTFTMQDKTNYFGSGTIRLGYAVQPAVLVYGQGGIAWANNADTVLQPSGALSESASWTQTGWTVGGGVEWAVAPNWSVFAEYNYMDFGSNSIQFNAAPGLIPVGEHINVSQTVQTALVGVNYRFHLGQ